MPVTFNTDLRDLKDFSYTPQVPLDALFKNMGYKQAKYDQTRQQQQASLNSIANIISYGQDTERKQQIINEVNQNLQKFAKMNYDDPASVNQLNAYIGSVANSEELVGIQARGLAYKELDEKYKKLTADGTEISDFNLPGMREAQEYYAGKRAYNPNIRFNGNVYKNRDWGKFEDNVFKAVTEEERIDPGKLYDEKYKEKQYQRLYDAYMRDLDIHSEYKSELERRFEHENVGTDWNDINLTKYRTALEAAKKTQLNALAIYKTATGGDRERALATFREAQKDEAFIQASMNTATPSARKFLEFNKSLEHRAATFAKSRLYVSHFDHQVNEIQAKYVQAGLDRMTHFMNNAADLGTMGLLPDGKGGYKISPTVDENGIPVEGVIGATKVSGGNGGDYINYWKTIEDLKAGDLTTMKVVASMFEGRLGIGNNSVIVSKEKDPKDSKTLVIKYFENTNDKRTYDLMTRNLEPGDPLPITVTPPSEVRITADDLVKYLTLQNNIQGRDIYRTVNGPGGTGGSAIDFNNYATNLSGATGAQGPAGTTGAQGATGPVGTSTTN